MKVIFIKELTGQAKKGEVKDVSEGHARNFLIPKGFAQIVTSQLQTKLEKEAKEATEKKQKDLAKLQSLKQELEKRTFTVKIKVGDKGQVFGAVHEKDIAKAVSDKMNVAIEKHQIEMQNPVKELGQHQAKIKLNSDIVANLKISVESQ